ncbi:MAG: NUDIX hydrolase [Planctomycetia bacterium]|nr:NUDIX hydrolase [Planctomycetia bacterium]
MKKRDGTNDVTVAETRHLRLIDRDGWSFVQRTACTGVVCIVAVTPGGELVLVEQYRAPLRQSVIELPAGLAGDIAGASDETLQTAAQRELLEETGYAAGEMRQVVTVASCPGLTDETVTFFLAGRLEQLGAGGGDGSEEITVHRVPLGTVAEWLAVAAAGGKLIDARVYSGLYFIATHDRLRRGTP